MKYIHFESSGMLAALAASLECCSYNTEDYKIAFEMDAPWLFLKEGDRFLAGQGLYTACMMNLYLLPRGFRLTETELSITEVPAYLRSHHPTILPMELDPLIRHPVVCTGYHDGRYTFINVKTAGSHEPDQLSLSRPMLLRRLDDKISVLTLEKCLPEATDQLPYLVQSLQTLDDYEEVIMNVCRQTVSRKELKALRTPVLRSLFVDMLPMAQLLQQPVLYEELHLLNHDYRHIFTMNSPDQVALFERLPRSSIRKCIAWMKENIVDRLYDHGLTDDQVEDILSQANGNC